MTPIRRLDHVAVLVRSTDEALRFYCDHLGLAVHSSEELDAPQVRLTYLDAGNAYIQLVEPLDPSSSLEAWLNEHGEGLHHICFGVDDVPAAVAELSEPGSEVVLGSGRGRLSSFITGNGNSVRIECTEFRREEDVDHAAGWLAPTAARGS
ncbi:MAG TPA: VOC family protein [Gaiellaceae bacterium]|nr:VOC family protein [Gaiellaceae bacterium]